MTSFFDVAGLVLAVLPLVCQGLDAYPDSFLVKFIRAKTELRTFARDLQIMQSSLRTAMIKIFIKIKVELTAEQIRVLKSYNIKGSEFFDVWREVLAANPDVIAAHYENSLPDLKQVLDEILLVLLKLTRGTPIPCDVAPEK